MNSLLPSKDDYCQSTSLNVRHNYERTKCNNFSDFNSAGPRSSVETDLKSPFSQLINNLIAAFCLHQTENANLSKESSNTGNIKEIFDQIEEIINQQYPQNRRSDALAILETDKRIFLHLLFQKNRCEPRELLPQHIETVLDALQQTTKFSHDQFYGQVRALENRKLQISLGLVEAITEMLVLDIEIFGIQLDGYEKCSKLRRSIGNSLMNLVYQQREAKHRLCTNKKFLEQITKIIYNVHPLVQFYAGLIQNISYNADQRIASNISITVYPLVCAAVQIAYGENENKFDLSKMQSQRRQNLLKILSALWNLAEDPIENKHVMCNVVPQFVPMLLKIMSSDERELQFIQAATGILKHLCTFIIQYPDLIMRIHRKGIIFAFMRQFSSSSPDLVADSINALAILSTHSLIAREILAKETYIQQIDYLVRSTNEGISRASRTLLDTIYSASLFYQFNNPSHSEMCFTSMASWPSKQIAGTNEQTNKHLQYQNYSTLPRTLRHHSNQQQIHFNDDHNNIHQNTPKGVLKQQNQSGPKWQLPNEIPGNQGIIKNTKNEEQEDNANPFIDESSTGLPTSVQCTREVSPRSCSFNSINDEKGGQEWNSSVQSASVRSSGMSTASASELPDSPSQWASPKVFQLKEMEMQILKALDENKQSGQCTNANVSGDTENQATNIAQEGKEEEEKEFGLRSTEEEMQSCNLLTQVIRDFMPKPIQPLQIHFNPTQNSTPILTPISCNSPCKSPTIRSETRRRKGAQFVGGNEGCLLDQSIAAVMPPRLFTSRNTSGGSEPSPNMMKMHNNSEDDEQGQEEISTKFPMDVAREIEAQIITVDCEKITLNKKERGELDNNNKCGTFSKRISQINQREKLRISPQKSTKPTKNAAPPLAPKPKLIQLQKVKRPGSSNGKTMESSKIVSL